MKWSNDVVYNWVLELAEAAFNAYKTAKEAFVKEQASEFKSQIDERAYEALMNYTVEIDD